MFRGITAISIDGKGRLAIPARYRDALMTDESSLVITIDPEETCLLLYPLMQWKLIEEKLQALPSFNPASRRIQRLLIGHASDVDIDTNGRLLLPPLLRDYATLDKKAVLIGQGNKFELWNEALWYERRESWLAEEVAATHNTLPDEMKSFSL